MTELEAAMLLTARLYAIAGGDKPQVQVFSSWDGLTIPPGTHVRVVVELLHDPDPEITPILEMELETV